MIYVIGDTHFGHKNIIDYANRPYKNLEEMHRDIIEKWNAIVTKRDTVIHVGDVAFGRNNLLIMNELKGTKRLVFGNHDRYEPELYKEVFSTIHPCGLKKHGVIFTHFPAHLDYTGRWSINVHGHNHDDFCFPGNITPEEHVARDQKEEYDRFVSEQTAQGFSPLASKYAQSLQQRYLTHFNANMDVHPTPAPISLEYIKQHMENRK